ncbi:polysaccharide pyruvyl transferase family protein [Salinimicrobium sp. 3283s]|uniref:polysaccharide pyruvyl transferase family protein n=1 Tax=Salinimicrobium sp. 3283s TaxID=3114359 RepID=UPI0031E7A27D
MNKTNIFINSIKEQQKLIFGSLGQLINKGTKVALLDFPNHNNVGDNAIWLGEKAALKKMGVEVVYQCDIYSFSEKALRKRLDNKGVILLHGGGNLGSVWPAHQNFREKIIGLFPEMRIIQLPQSVHFDDDNRKMEFGRIAKAHKDCYFLLRDHSSFNTLKDLGLRVRLCPDMAFAMGPVPQKNKSVVDIVWLKRTDHETAGNKGENFSFKTEKLDWLAGEPGRFYSKFSPKFTVRVRGLVQSIFRKSKLFRDHFWRLNAASFDLLAQRRFQRGTRILCRGKIVLTDRLHGHIVSTLLGKPQVLFDNHYRKIGNYIDCFESTQEAIFYVGDDKLNVEAKVSKALELVKKRSKDE